MNTLIITLKNKINKSGGKAPDLSSIPLGIYSDEMQKVRDKRLFLKIRQLQKNAIPPGFK